MVFIQIQFWMVHLGQLKKSSEKFQLKVICNYEIRQWLIIVKSPFDGCSFIHLIKQDKFLNFNSSGIILYKALQNAVLLEPLPFIRAISFWTHSILFVRKQTKNFLASYKYIFFIVYNPLIFCVLKTQWISFVYGMHLTFTVTVNPREPPNYLMQSMFCIEDT